MCRQACLIVSGTGVFCSGIALVEKMKMQHLLIPFVYSQKGFAMRRTGIARRMLIKNGPGRINGEPNQQIRKKDEQKRTAFVRITQLPVPTAGS